MVDICVKISGSVVMVIAYCANRAIYHVLPTAVNSLMVNNPQVEKIYLMIEDDDIPFFKHSKITFVNLNNYGFLIRDGINITEKFPYTAMVRCSFSRILKEPKIIYLDVDTIVDGNLTELWNFNIGGKCIGAREEYGGYFNSGVLLMNLNLIRALKMDERLKNILTKCKFQFPDQDAMNIIFKDSVAYIPSHFNRMGRDEAYNTQITVRHFAGITKPWKHGATQKDIDFWRKYYADEIKEA